MSQKTELNTQTLQKYVDLEKKINQLESANVFKNYSMKKDQLQDLSRTIEDLKKHHEECCQQTAKEKADVDNLHQPSVKNFFKDKQSFDATLSKEQEEYVQAMNKQEVAKQQLDGVTQQKNQLQSEVSSLEAEYKKLEAAYNEQDALLGGIFNGEYGSDLENKLEEELDLLADRKQRICVAKDKWTNARVLLNHACNQLAFAVKRWQDVPKAPPNNLQVRYNLATETRNNLIAAGQNVHSARRYLSNIEFPYLKPLEVDTLNRACENIYTDMQSHDRLQHALTCYVVTHKRAAALLQWFDYVLKETIEKDHCIACKTEKEKSMQLKKERLRLIKIKVEETGGKVDLPAELSGRDMMSQEKEEQTSKPEGLAETGPGDQQSTEGSTRGVTPLSLSELAPAPSQDELFGNINQLKKQHEEEQTEFQKRQELNKARMEQGFQEKMAARRSRRRRVENME